MNNRSLRYAKLMKTMGIPEQQEPIRQIPDQKVPVAPEKFEALIGTEHPELKEKRRMKMLIDSKIAQIEQSDDPIAMESLNFWKQKLAELEAE